MPAAARAGSSLSVSSCTVVSALVAIWKTSPPTPSTVAESRTAPIEVVHEDEVAGLGAVAVDLQHFSLHSPLDKARDDAVLVAREGPVDVPEAQRDGLYAEGLEVRRTVALACELARPVGRDGMRDHLLVYRRLDLPDNRPPAGGEDETPHIIVTGRLEVVERADDVAHAVAPGVLDRGHHPRVRREMNDDVSAPRGP